MARRMNRGMAIAMRLVNWSSNQGKSVHFEDGLDGGNLERCICVYVCTCICK